MIPAVVVAFLSLALAVWVLAPLRQRRRQPSSAAMLRLEEAVARKNRSLEAIIDLERERDAGKLSAVDFEVLKGEQEREALEALREIDLLEQADGDALEGAIAEARERLACPACGAPRLHGSTCACEA